VTSGTLIDEALLDDAAPNRLAAIAFVDTATGMRAGLAIVEASTGEFTVLDTPTDRAGAELARRGVRELLYAELQSDKPPERVTAVLDAIGAPGTPRPGWQFRLDEATEALQTAFGVSTLDGFGLRESDPAVQAAGAVVRYLRETQTPSGEDANHGRDARVPTLAHLRPPRRETTDGRCVVDAISLRALEVERTIRSTGGSEADGSLLGVFIRAKTGAGNCRTPMGRRLLRDWLCAPLGDAEAIVARQRCVGALHEDRRTADELGSALGGVQDVTRIAGRIALARVTPRDLVALGLSLASIETLLEIIEPADAFATPERWRRCERPSRRLASASCESA
jgi:DNA mismatch repair protein MutS